MGMAASMEGRAAEFGWGQVMVLEQSHVEGSKLKVGGGRAQYMLSWFFRS